MYQFSLFKRFAFYIAVGIFFSACGDNEDPVKLQIKTLTPEQALSQARAIESSVSPQLAEGLTLKIWATDSLLADPVSIDVDDKGRLYYSRTNRQKNSEFDIRGHEDWEIQSIALKTIEEKSAFLKKVLSPEKSKDNNWLKDLNNDGSRDWRDLTVEKEQVFRIEDKSGDGIADHSQLVVEGFNSEVTDAAGAIMAEGNEVFFGVGPDMWRLTDKNNDGFAEDKKAISSGYGIHVGFSGHGMSGLEMGPDGKVYWQIGDIGFNGKSPDGKVHEYPNSGVVVRSNPDGSDFEVFAYGNRNVHEFVFDDYGNMISVDNDGDHPGENERLVYVVDGADIGWRINWQFGKYRDKANNTYKVWMDEKMYKPRFEGQAAYFLPTLANYISGPTGMVYNPGTALGPQWKNTFFVGEFNGNPSTSGIHAFKLKPKGASFELSEAKNFVKGILATGIDFGPDGAMYMADWINGWGTKNYGRVWKIDVAGGTNQIRKQTQQLIGDDFTKYPESKLSQLLRHEDKRVRQKSQFELVSRGDDGLEIFEQTIKDRKHQLARIHAIWGITQLARKEEDHAGLLMPLLNDADAEIAAQAARWLGDLKEASVGPRLVPLLRHPNARVRFFAAEALGKISYQQAINPIIDMLRVNNDEDVYLRHAGSLALARIGKEAPLVALSRDKSKPVRIAAVVALRRMLNPGIATFLKDQDEFVVTEAARAINDDLNIAKALPALADLLTTTSFTNEPLIRRSINANLEMGTGKAMQNLLSYAQNEKAPVAMRTEALAALSTWANPSVLDRVDGRYRGALKRDVGAVTNVAAAPLIKLASHPLDEIRVQAVKAINKLKISSAAGDVFSRLKADRNANVRVEALNALANLKHETLNDAIKFCLADKDKSVRIVALDLLAKSNMPKPETASLLAKVIQTRTPEEKQAAVITLGTLPLSHTQKIFENLLSQKKKGTLAPEVDVELEEAIVKLGSADLKKRYEESSRYTGPDSLYLKYRGTLTGGNADHGREIFFSNQTAQCLRCHSYDDMGGNAGPRLNGVASRLLQKQILEALITPSARIAPGFGTVNLELKNGKNIVGILQKETTAGTVIKSGKGVDTLIKKNDIAKSTQSGSSMPPMHLLLSKKEIRDLVSFLNTQK
jgi:putative membrane-bound dehydrogenase-like protein